MPAQQTSSIFVRNDSAGRAWIRLYHHNSTHGTQSAGWFVEPGGVAGPLTVRFETGFGAFAVLDYWSLSLAVVDGPAPGSYANSKFVNEPGTPGKECQLESADAGREILFTADEKEFRIGLPSGGCTDAMIPLGSGHHPKVSHVFVLMLENHSFDHLFAFSGIPGIRAATAADGNAFQGVRYPVASPAPARMPTDPGHEFPDVVEQLAGFGAAYPKGGPYPPVNNGGFAANYAATASEGGRPQPADIGDILRCFDTPRQLPVLHQLATEFALCDQWFSALPGPTWPNRYFVHGASSAGLDHSPTGAEIAEWEALEGFSYRRGSIFDLLGEYRAFPWRLYHDADNAFSDAPDAASFTGAIPQATSIEGVSLLDCHPLTHFARDLQNPYPHAYTFIEPHYGDVTGGFAGGSSQHPMDGMRGGEGLIKAVYEAIRNSPLWETSLLIVTYDEHGGFYDSCPPPAVAPPNDGPWKPSLNRNGFTFDRLGVRVPAVVVSPWIPRGVVDSTIYEHSTVPATVEAVFDLPFLTDRDRNAATVLGLASLPAPRKDCPAVLNPPAPPAGDRTPTDGPAEPAGRPEALPASGNLRGFLHAALKADWELSGGGEAGQAALKAGIRRVTTRGQARAYLSDLTGRVADGRAARRAARAGGRAISPEHRADLEQAPAEDSRVLGALMAWLRGEETAGASSEEERASIGLKWDAVRTRAEAKERLRAAANALRNRRGGASPNPG